MAEVQVGNHGDALVCCYEAVGSADIGHNIRCGVDYVGGVLGRFVHPVLHPVLHGTLFIGCAPGATVYGSPFAEADAADAEASISVRSVALITECRPLNDGTCGFLTALDGGAPPRLERLTMTLNTLLNIGGMSHAHFRPGMRIAELVLGVDSPFVEVTAKRRKVQKAEAEDAEGVAIGRATLLLIRDPNIYTEVDGYMEDMAAQVKDVFRVTGDVTWRFVDRDDATLELSRNPEVRTCALLPEDRDALKALLRRVY